MVPLAMGFLSRSLLLSSPPLSQTPAPSLLSFTAHVSRHRHQDRRQEVQTQVRDQEPLQEGAGLQASEGGVRGGCRGLWGSEQGSGCEADLAPGLDPPRSFVHLIEPELFHLQVGFVTLAGLL